MIIKILEQTMKLQEVTNEDNSKEFIEVPDKLITKRFNLPHIDSYTELVNPRNNKLFKDRCLVCYNNDWYIAKHSFDYITKLKQTQERITVKGFKYGR
jgi:hypothetical protein